MSEAALWLGYQVVAATGGALVGVADWTVGGLSIDTRSLKPGDLFVALQAARDGHDFVEAAFEKGASAAIVSRRLDVEGPQIVVPDTLVAIERLAAAARDRYFGPILGVTGSAGKTTTKEMLRLALSPLGEVHAADKSFNNHIGVPLTLSELPVSAKAAVIEMGMNHAGEIRTLTTLAKPHIAMITTVAEAHLENLGSLEGIADAKAEIAEGLRPGGVMLLPADNPFFHHLKRRCREAGVSRMLSFGKAGDDARLTGLTPQDDGLLVKADIQGTRVSFALASKGEHMASNAVAALLAASVAGVDPQDAAEALSRFTSGEGRGGAYQLAVEGKMITVLDESYNANPASMRASFSILAQAPGRRVAVLGEMKELGPTGAELHAGLAPDVQAAANRVFTAGPDMQHLADALPADLHAGHGENAAGLLQPLLAELQEGDTVLFKGSNASRVGDLVQALLKAGQRL